MNNINLNFWKNLELEIQKTLQSPVKIIFPNQLNNKYIEWYFKIEKEAFRESLRYNRVELQQRFNYQETLFFFIVNKKNPIAVLLGYEEPIKKPNLFYLDTIATIVEKKGIGTLIMKYLIQWVKIKKFSGIKLDTELFTERGILLKAFYEKFGFKSVRENENGNITMEYHF